jgi:NAD(P)-dependent dehydrogenase (short-subunit alcohol dehydrogenase family)
MTRSNVITGASKIIGMAAAEALAAAGWKVIRVARHTHTGEFRLEVFLTLALDQDHPALCTRPGWGREGAPTVDHLRPAPRARPVGWNDRVGIAILYVRLSAAICPFGDPVMCP